MSNAKELITELTLASATNPLVTLERVIAHTLYHPPGLHLILTRPPGATI